MFAIQIPTVLNYYWALWSVACKIVLSFKFSVHIQNPTVVTKSNDHIKSLHFHRSFEIFEKPRPCIISYLENLNRFLLCLSFAVDQ